MRDSVWADTAGEPPSGTSNYLFFCAFRLTAPSPSRPSVPPSSASAPVSSPLAPTSPSTFPFFPKDYFSECGRRRRCDITPGIPLLRYLAASFPFAILKRLSGFPTPINNKHLFSSRPPFTSVSTCSCLLAPSLASHHLFFF